MSKEIDGSMEYIDSRSVIERIAELTDNNSLSDEEKAELASLESLKEECQPYCGDWEYGALLIHEDKFAEYAQDLFRDTTDLSTATLDRWPFNCIDWSKAAQELAQDYFSVEFDGETYYFM
jgi:hypothetical protein